MYRPVEYLYYQRPLATRAWCYQEQRLARRVLHMCVDEMVWDCTGGILECQCSKFGPGKMEYSLFTWQKSLAERACSTKEKHSLWLNIVYNYSERELTIWTDRLPALSGLAKQFLVTPPGEPEVDRERKRHFRDISLGTYLAGIWSSSLPSDLAWHAAHMPGKRLSAESSRYVAPSWSWVSVSGNVNWAWDRAFEPRVQILSARCDLAGPDETGAVVGGEIGMTAKLIPLKLLYGDLEIPRSNGTRHTYMQLEARDPSTGKFASMAPSMYLPDYVPPQIACLEMAFHAGADMLWGDGVSDRDELTPLLDAEYFGLQLADDFVMVVRPVAGEGGNILERVGAVQRNYDGRVPDLAKWFEGADMRTIRLV